MIIQLIISLILLEYINNKLKIKYNLNNYIVPSYSLDIISKIIILTSLKIGYYSASTYYTVKKYILNVFLINLRDLIFTFAHDIFTSFLNIFKPLLIMLMSPLYLIKGWFDRTSQSFIKTEILLFFNKINNVILNNYISKIKIKSVDIIENIKFCAYCVINFIEKIILNHPSIKIITSILLCLLCFFNASIVYYPIFLTMIAGFYYVKINNTNNFEQ